MSIQYRARCHGGGLGEWPDGVTKTDGHTGRGLIYLIDDQAGYRTITAMRVHNDEAFEAMVNKTVRGLQVNFNNRVSRKRNRARKTHVIRRLAGHQDRSTKYVPLLRDQFASFDTCNEIGADGQVTGVLFQSANRNDDHIRFCKQRFDSR